MATIFEQIKSIYLLHVHGALTTTFMAQTFVPSSSILKKGFSLRYFDSFLSRNLSFVDEIHM